MQDSLTIGVTVFSTCLLVIALGVLRYVFLQSDFLAEMQAFQNAASAVRYFDYIPPAVLIGSFISSMYFSSRIRAHPVYVPVSFLFLMVATVVGYIMSVLPAEMAEYMVFGQVFSQYGMTSIIFQNLHLIVFVSGLTGMIALYALQGNRHGGGQPAPLR